MTAENTWDTIKIQSGRPVPERGWAFLYTGGFNRGVAVMLDSKVISQLPGMEAEQVFAALDTSPAGLSARESDQRMQLYGKNELPKPAPRSL